MSFPTLPYLNVKHDYSIQNTRLCKRRRPEFLSRTQSTVVGEEEEVTTALILENFPADVCGREILSYLPGKNVQTLKIVCKDWLQLITSSDFVRLHLSKSIRSRNRVLMNSLFIPTIIEYNNYDKGTVQQIAYPPQFSSGFSIFGSANGLAFLFENLIHSQLIGVFNPSTGESSVVKLCPFPPTHPRTYYPCFCDLGGGKYVLVMLMWVVGVGFETGVYKFTRGSDTGSMNKICSNQNTLWTYYEILENKGTFVRGVVHWAARFDHGMSKRYTILAYHIGENKHTELSPPAQGHFSMGLFVDGCSLLATSYYNGKTELWIMKESCWTKIATIGPGCKFPRTNPLGFFPNGDLIMDVAKSRLMKYSFNHDETTLLMDYGELQMDGVIMCADTLLSPDCMIN